LGRVGSVAEVFVNGARAGVAWMQPYRLDVTKHLRAGHNTLRVLVTNTPQNYVAGLKDLGAVPEHYAQGAALWRSRDRDIPLPMSGLPGPVSVAAARIITMEVG
jgi:(4-O-methyl)-D-glucuronate---lignin esterase